MVTISDSSQGRKIKQLNGRGKTRPSKEKKEIGISATNGLICAITILSSSVLTSQNCEFVQTLVWKHFSSWFCNRELFTQTRSWYFHHCIYYLGCFWARIGWSLRAPSRVPYSRYYKTLLNIRHTWIEVAPKSNL